MGVTGVAMTASASMARVADSVSTSQTPAAAGNKPILAMIAYPGMFPLDLVGPEAVFAGLGTHRVGLVWKSHTPVRSTSGLAIVPTMTFEEAEEAGPIDIIFVPGGTVGTLACMEDPQVLGFLRRHAPTASYVTSICTGSLVLGAAGLLDGYRATSHWVVRDRLTAFGATPVEARVVEDRNRVTGAGVTAGIDMALTLAARLVGENHAKALQLNIEYDPHPPFNAGTPQGAGREVVDHLSKVYAPFIDQVNVVVPRAAAKVLGS